MNRKILLKVASAATAVAFGCAFAVTAVFGGPSIKAKAGCLTQATDASKVSYGTLTESDVAIIKQIFDFNYYRTQNPELEARFGNDYNAWLDHFCKYGLFEGRTCNADFDPAAYASAYSDLRSAFGTNIMAYYKHYVNEGQNDPNRQITTLKECAQNGITVQSLNDSDVNITPQLYTMSEKFKTNNYEALSAAVSQAIVEAAAVGGTAVISNGEESVVITDDSSSSSETSTQATDNTDSSNASQSSSDSAASGSSEETSGGSSESSGDSQQSSDTTGGGSAAVNVLDGYQITKTLTVGDYSTNFTIEIYRGSTGGYGAWGVTSIYSAENSSTTTELMDKTEGYTYSDPTDDGYGGYEGYGDKVASVSCSAYSMGSSSSSSGGEAESGIGIGVYASDATGSTIDGNIIQNTGTSRTETSEWEGVSETYTMIVDPDGTTDTVYGVGVNLEETDTGVEATVAVGGSDGYGLEESFDVQDNTSGNE